MMPANIKTSNVSSALLDLRSSFNDREVVNVVDDSEHSLDHDDDDRVDDADELGEGEQWDDEQDDEDSVPRKVSSE